MTHWITGFNTFLEDPNSGPGTHIGQLTTICNSFFQASDTIFCLYSQVQIYKETHMHTPFTEYIHILLKFIFKYVYICMSVWK